MAVLLGRPTRNPSHLAYGNLLALNGNIRNESTATKKLALPLWLNGDSVLFGSNAIVNVESVISGPGGLHAAVTNTVYLSGDNSYEGVTTVSNGCRLLIRHSNALGSPSGSTRVYGRTGASLRLDNGITVAEPITLVGQILPWLNCMTAGGGSNIITGTLHKELDASIGTDGGSTLIIRGGVKHVSGGTLYIRNTGSVVFEDKPIEFGTAAAVQVETSGTTVLAVPGNTFSTLKIANHAKVRTDVAGALPPSCLLDIGGNWDADGLLNLNGHDQTVGAIKTDPRWSAPGYLAVTSAAPATLTANQGSTTLYAGAFAGAVTLVKNNAGRITITNVTSTTTGDVILNGGSIVIAETAAFSACPTFKVNGGTLELRSSTALPDTATVRVLEGAKVSIKDGVTDTVDKLFLDGDNSYGGVTTIETNYAIIRHARALGTADANTVIKDGAYLVAEGGLTLDEPINMTGEASLNYQGTLRSNAGTNTLTAKLTSNGARLRTNNNGCWEVTGGVDGGGFTCTAVSGTYIRFTEKPITTSGFTCHTYGGSVILAVAGNTFTSMEAGGTELRTDVPNAWPATVSLIQGSSGSAS